jgi:hypothetical protein
VRHGDRACFVVLAENTGCHAWRATPASGPCEGATSIDVRLVRAGDGARVGAFLLPLDGDVAPGERARFDVGLHAALPPGRYRLEIDLLWHGFGRLSRFAGAAPAATVEVEVEGAPDATAQVEPSHTPAPHAPHETADPHAALLSRVPALASQFYNAYYTPERAQDRLRALIEAARARQPFSMIRVGDMETRLLGFGRAPHERASLRQEAAALAQHTGVDPMRLSWPALWAVQEELAAACRDADVLGTHRHTVNVAWSDAACRVLPQWGLAYEPAELDVVFNAEVLDQGFLLPLLGGRRVLLVGNPAPRFAELLRDDAYRRRFATAGMPREAPVIADAVFVPHQGDAAWRALPALWRRIETCDFDLALVAASVAGKLLCARIKRARGAVALDVGWSMQFLADCPSPVGASRQAGRRGFVHLFTGRQA